MRIRMATAVGSPTPSTLRMRSSRSARSSYWRMSATTCLSSNLRTALKRRISSSQWRRTRSSRQDSRRVSELGNVLGDLLDEGQMLGKGRQARIGRGMDLLGGRRTSCDQASVDLVVLCSLQVKHGIRSYLRGLEHDDHKTIAPKLADNCLLVAAARLDADSLDAMLA